MASVTVHRPSTQNECVELVVEWDDPGQQQLRMEDPHKSGKPPLETSFTNAEVTTASCLARMRKPSVWFIFVAFCLSTFAMALVFPLIPQVVTKLCGKDVGQASLYIGFISASQALATLFSVPILGALSDHFGRKPIIIVSLIGSGVDYLTIGAATHFELSLWVIFFSRTISGLTSGSFCMAYAYAADVSLPNVRSRNFGLIGAAMGLAMMCGPALSGYLSKFSEVLAFSLAVAAIAIDLLFVVFVVPESLNALDSTQRTKEWSWLRVIPFRSASILFESKLALGTAVAYLVMFLGEEGIICIFVLYFQYTFHWDSLQIGLMISAWGVTCILAQGVVLRLAVRYMNDKLAILVSLAVGAMTAFPYALLSNGYHVYALIAIRSFSQLATPLMKGVMSRQYKPEQQGELFGVLTSLYTLTSFVGPLLYNTLFSYLASLSASSASADASVDALGRRILQLMALLHSNGPGLIYYLISLITLAALLLCTMVFVAWKDRTTQTVVALIETEEETDNSADARGRVVGDYEYEKVLLIVEDEVTNRSTVV